MGVLELPRRVRALTPLRERLTLSRASALAAAVALALLALVGFLRAEPGALRGDEGTFVAMAASLARDGDLRFTAPDRAWAEARPERPATLILERTEQGVAYSKPILYPLLAAPFVAAGAERALWLFNALVVGAALVVARRTLALRPGGERAGDLLLLVACGSIVVPYLAWWMTESLQFALALAGLALALRPELDPGREPRHERAALVGALLLGLLVALREPNGAVAAVPVLAALSAKRWARAVRSTLGVAVGYGAIVLLTLAMTGAPSPYKAARSTFDAATGYPAGDGAARALARFEFGAPTLATSSLELEPKLEPRRSAYAFLYFFVGRHSGLLVYFPAVWALLFALRRGVDRTGRAALVGFAGAATFYLVWWPSNYFGGETHVGNRYLIAAFACLPFVPRTLPGPRALAAGWVAGFVVALSALVSLRHPEARGAASQSHTLDGLFRLLPYESIASNIDGRRDRYWAGDFLRFVDPFADVHASAFELEAGRPAAEVELATAWPARTIRLLAVADRPNVALEVHEGWSRRALALTPNGRGGAGGVVTVSLSSTWRRHRFWWRSERPYDVRFLRLRLIDREGGAAKVRLRYLGRGSVPETGFEREPVALVLPTIAVAGGRSELEVGAINRGPRRWSASDSLPVLVAARLAPLVGDAPEREWRARFEQPVAPGDEGRARLAIDWPAAPGRYRLTVDLVMEDVAWFAERVGAPLGSGEVEIVPELSAAPTASAGPVSPPASR